MITQIDFGILEAIQKITNPVLDVFFTFVTHLGDGGMLWIVTAIILFFFKKTRKCSLMMMLALILGAFIGNITLKPLIARARPFIQNADMAAKLLIDAPHGFSFPSGHTLSSFAGAFSIFLYNKKYGVVALVVAALIAFSRLYLYVHFPTDIIAGTVLGIGCAFIAKIIYDKLFLNKIKIKNFELY